MKKRIFIFFLLLILCTPLIACTSYKTITNTKKLTNYEYNITKNIVLNDGNNETILIKGYVNNDKEKRITIVGDKEFETYYETTKNGSFKYSKDKNNDYQRKRIPYLMTSYINLINKDWFKFENGKVTLDNSSHSKILRLLRIHKYIADDIELDNYLINDDNNIINSLEVSLKLLKNKEIVGTCNLKLTIDNINKVENITLPTIKERA